MQQPSPAAHGHNDTCCLPMTQGKPIFTQEKGVPMVYSCFLWSFPGWFPGLDQSGCNCKMLTSTSSFFGGPPGWPLLTLQTCHGCSTLPRIKIFASSRTYLNFRCATVTP